jgi:SNF2 family DNA or RNA helicase
MKIIDNVNQLLGDDLKQQMSKSSKLKIAASCFSIYAFEALKKELDKIDELQFIFTSPTFLLNEVSDNFKKEQKEFHISKFDREKGFYGSEFEIQLKNKLNQKAIARECADWIRKKGAFRSNKTKAPMQQFACVQNESDSAVYMPLHGFTAVDLGYQMGNAVSNIVNKFDEAENTKIFLNLFDQIWNTPENLEDVTTYLCNHIASVYQENSPERIYFLMLYNIFNEFLEDLTEDVLPNDRTGYQDSLIWKKLFNFQIDAAKGIINKLETFNGCILADSVGLGKTFTALAVIKYYELRNRSVLVLCPKKLADNWLTYNRNLTTNIFAKDRFNYDVLCHTDLQRTSGESFGIPLNRVNWGNYDLVVIDESHNFRNNDAYKDKETRYKKLMDSVIRQGVKTKVLMLSATPVNNRFNDLRNQLALAYEGESKNLKDKLRVERDIETIFRRAQMSFNTWSSLAPEDRTTTAILNLLDFDFFELLDSVTIARSRKHIETFYDTTEIGKFPQRLKPLSFHCPLSLSNDVIKFNVIFDNLSALTLAIYAPISYILPSRLKEYEIKYDTQVSGGKKFKQTDREKSLQALMTVNLLKRLESSVESFRLTLKKLKQNHENVLLKIDNFKSDNKLSFSDVSGEFENVDIDDENLPNPDDETIGNKVQIKLADMDLPSWQRELEADLVLIENLLSEMEKVTPHQDAKLQHLKTHIQQKINNPINQGNKKVIIFTAFADTASYLYEHLAYDLQHHHHIHTAKVTGSDTPKSTLKNNYDFQSILTLFSPKSKSKSVVLPNESSEIDILIATDCISEGQNLQDCDYLINYDIHWNPVRIIQRFGRIDRIGSQNNVIQLVNYWADISLDEYINLKERVENRMAIGNLAAAGNNVLSNQDEDISYRKEQLKKLQNGEVIEMEDVKTGVSITDLGLNDFRMDLLNYKNNNQVLANVPTGMHAVIPANPDIGLTAGVIFTLRNRNEGISISQFNRLHPYYLVYIGQDGTVLNNHLEVKRLLDLARAACKGKSQPIFDACEKFNKMTKDGRDMSLYSNLLDQAIRSIIDVKEEKDIASLFSGGKTTALLDKISGLDDFELLTFLVIQD